MKSNFTTVLKKKAIANVPSFSDMKANRIKVIANSPNYPNSVTLPMDAYCDMNTDGYVFYNAATGDTYAMTAVDVSTALNSMIKDKKCVVIQDEISLKEPGEIYWFAHTTGDIVVADDSGLCVNALNGEP